MCKLIVNKRSIGVCFEEDAADIHLWASQAATVRILVNGTTHLPMEKQEHGCWHLHTSELKPGDSYTFLVNGKPALPDPASVSQKDGVHGPSYATDLAAFKWTDREWKNPPLQDYIIYELHTGTFSPEGTFSGIENKLDHLVELGITAIELMPVTAFPGTRNWGYDAVCPFAVQASYGGAEGLQRLVNTCHRKGLAVILDVVYNHLGPEGNYLKEYGPYFTDKYKTPWGAAINFDDAGCDAVRSFVLENALMWLRDFHIDALRLDAVHAIKDFSPVHILQEMKQHIKKLSALTGRDHYLFIECDLNDPKFIAPAKEGGYEANAQWSDEFHHALRITAGQKPKGFFTDFHGIADLAKAYADAYVYDGQFSEYRQKTFGKKADQHPGEQFIVFSQNHDQVGNRMLGERTSLLVSFEMRKLMAAAVMVSPFLPLLFMGEEWSETNPFLYFVNYSDTGLARAVREGRQNEFKDLHTDGEAPDPSCLKTFERSLLQWELLEKEPHTTMLRYYKTLIKLRKNYFSPKDFPRKQLTVQAFETQQTLSLHRWSEEQHTLCLLNFSKGPQQIADPVDGSEWKKLLDSSEQQWGGDRTSTPGTLNKHFLLQPESILILLSEAHV